MTYLFYSVFILCVNGKFLLCVASANNDFPLYYDISPCSCDLTYGNCDTYCCCDIDCKSISSLPFSCVPGSYGGEKTPKFPSLLCNSSKPALEDLSPFLCLEYENTPYLGRFFGTPDLARNKQQFQKLIVSKDDGDDSEYSHSDYSLLNSDGYIEGQAIQTERDDEFYGFLSLPSSIWNGHCVFTSPIRYLKDFKSECVYTFDDERCKHSGQLLINPDLYSAEILAKPGGKLVQNFTTRYLCIDDDRKSNYLEIEVENAKPCYFSPQIPKLGSNGNYCTNSVVSVKYDFSWKGNDLVSIESTITLGTVSSPVYQIFQVRFHHIRNDDSKKRKIDPKNIRSGVLGYNPQSPLVVASSNGSDIGKLKYLRLLSSDRNGRCSDMDKTEVLFGHDVFSGCLISLNEDEFQDCDKLRIRLKKYESMNVDWINRNGNPSMLNISKDFVPILEYTARDSIANDSVYKWNRFDSPDGRCSNISNHVHLTVLYSETGEIYGRRFHVVLGAQIRFHNVTWSVVNNDSSYLITNRVTFVKVPATKNKKIKRFWDHPFICQGDSCWEELWYPGVVLSPIPVVSAHDMISWTVVTLMFIIPCIWIYFSQLK